MRSDIEEEFDATKLMDDDHNFESDCGTSKEAKEVHHRVAADVALCLGFCGRHTTRGYLSKAREETNRALTHAKSARHDGFERILDRYNKDKVYAALLDPNDIDKTMMQGWGSLCMGQEAMPLSIHCVR